MSSPIFHAYASHSAESKEFVEALTKLLADKGLLLCPQEPIVDNENAKDALCEIVEQCACGVIFLSAQYISEAAQLDNPLWRSKRELKLLFHTKGPKGLVVVALDEYARNKHNWSGIVGLELAELSVVALSPQNGENIPDATAVEKLEAAIRSVTKDSNVVQQAGAGADGPLASLGDLRKQLNTAEAVAKPHTLKDGFHCEFVGTVLSGTPVRGEGVFKCTEGNNKGATYVGLFEDHRMVGKGLFKFANGTVFEGDMPSGKRDGKGIYRDERHNYHEGEFLSGKRHGKGHAKNADGSEYNGMWQDDMRNGFGSDKDTKGHTFTGYWVNNKPHGNGMFKDDSGNMYQGEWQAGKRHGQGTYTYANGDSYVGAWENDKANGKGVCHYAAGNRYEGQWMNNRKHGVGTMHYENGNVYQGEWQNDKKSGARGVMKYANGDMYDGQWEAGKRHGRGHFRYANGTTYEGEWVADKKEGFGVKKTAKGRVEEGQWAADKFVGTAESQCTSNANNAV